MVTRGTADNGESPGSTGGNGSTGWTGTAARGRSVAETASPPREGHVVVGVDGSPGSLAALRWAAYEATLRGCPLRVLHCVSWPAMAAALGVPPAAPPTLDLSHESEDVLAAAVAAARATASTIPVSGAVIDGAPGTVLVEESERASLVVVGTRGVGGFTGLLLGSISGRVAMHARCPVVVVPPGFDPRSVEQRRIVVGVDGSEPAGVAARFALVEALLRQAPVTAVRAVDAPAGLTAPTARPGADPERVAAEEGLAAAMTTWRQAFPTVRVEHNVVTGRPVGALVQAAQDAQLLVVGSRGVGGFRGLLLGSVSLRLLHHTVCPVVVVHPHHHHVDQAKHRPLATASV